MRTFEVTILCACIVGSRLCRMVAHTYCCGVGGSWWSSKTQKKLIFYANKSVDGLQLSEYLANFKKWGTILIVTSCLTLSMPYFTSGGHFSDLLRCSKVRQLKVAIVTLKSDQQGDIYPLFFRPNRQIIGGPALKLVKKMLQMPFLELYHVYILYDLTCLI